MKRVAILVGFAAALMLAPTWALAGPDLSLSGVQEAENQDTQGRVALGGTYGVGFAEVGLRTDDGFDAVVGVRGRLGPVEVRLGALGLLNHEGTHDFGDAYGDVNKDQAFGYGGTAELSLDIKGWQPFVRYQEFKARHDYIDIRQTGTGPNGGPIYGDRVEHEELEEVEELEVGIRVSL